MPFEEWGNLYTNECINKWNPSSVQFYNFGVMITHSENWQKKWLECKNGLFMDEKLY